MAARTEKKWSGEIKRSCNVLQIKNGEIITEVKGLNLLAENIVLLSPAPKLSYNSFGNGDTQLLCVLLGSLCADTTTEKINLKRK